jgi:hypothetical protein
MAVTANQLTKRQEGNRQSFPVAASTTIYEGTLAFLSVLGYLASVTATGVNRFAGVALAFVDNASGSAGDVQGEVYTEGVFELVGTGFTQASVGLPVFATDNYTITTGPSASGVYIGECVGYVSSTKILVCIDPDGTSPVSTTVVKTADYTVTVGESGRTFTNTGAAGAVTFAMPAAVAGLKYRFRVGVAQQLRIDPNGTETISLPSTGVPSAAGAYIVADAIGETVDIQCVEAGSWSVFGYTGTWTAV